MSKFKVGDIVIGNKFAYIYAITREGIKAVVVDVAHRLICVEIISDVIATYGTKFPKGNTYWVDEHYFDLVKPKKRPKNYCDKELEDMEVSIIYRKNKTILKVLKEGKVIRTVISRCHPTDEFSVVDGTMYPVGEYLGLSVEKSVVNKDKLKQ